MSTWSRALDAAGITDPALRDDYTEQRVLVAGFKRSAYVAARLLLPRPLVPHVIAATAFMHRSDNVLDEGPLDERTAAYAAWEKQVREGLDTGGSDEPVIRALLHTMTAHPRLRGHVEDYLTTAAADLDFTGFATEADYQAYVDAYSLPAFMLVAGLLAPRDGDGPGGSEGYREACRTYIDASQRLDFVNDLAEDLRDGRLTLPEEALAHHGVTRADLESAKDTDGTRALIREALDKARRTLDVSRGLVDRTPPAGRPLVRALIRLDDLTLAAARAEGAGLLRASASPSAPSALRVLAREYLRARRLR
ncbi:phytoene/squalene synthase family protein [Wenjunlia tyrosinilytica]|uniref:Phytoene synthase n=1 Tax=Wenjunlia tyrosinilytica TaxID=1544741 RepID=A0A917ZTA8_9ACTN|nr:squalene/phytoene synthase family protein [Wenjunlia tyrosinilytica]GGO90609.1 phytoene synthase [Wenjunlia tyrosinilytica]